MTHPDRPEARQPRTEAGRAIVAKVVSWFGVGPTADAFARTVVQAEDEAATLDPWRAAPEWARSATPTTSTDTPQDDDDEGRPLFGWRRDCTPAERAETTGLREALITTRRRLATAIHGQSCDARANHEGDLGRCWPLADAILADSGVRAALASKEPT